MSNEKVTSAATVKKGTSTSVFTGKTIDFEGEAKKNSELGKAGEDAVVKYEQDYLISKGRKDLANKVKATRELVGNAERFDVLSYDENGNEKYIEVKTTKGGLNSIFHISENEVAFSWQYADKYYLYRVYNLNPNTKTAKVKTYKGAITRGKLQSTEYACRIESMEKYNKLVRDKIPEIIYEQGRKTKTHILDDMDYRNELNKKLKEEVYEYLENNNVEELTDIVEVIYGILDNMGVSIEDFENIRLAKVKKRGAFKKKIFLDDAE